MIIVGAVYICILVRLRSLSPEDKQHLVSSAVQPVLLDSFLDFLVVLYTYTYTRAGERRREGG